MENNMNINYIKMLLLVISGKSDNRHFFYFFINSLKYTCIHF